MHTSPRAVACGVPLQLTWLVTGTQRTRTRDPSHCHTRGWDQVSHEPASQDIGTRHQLAVDSAPGTGGVRHGFSEGQEDTTQTAQVTRCPGAVRHPTSCFGFASRSGREPVHHCGTVGPRQGRGSWRRSPACVRGAYDVVGRATATCRGLRASGAHAELTVSAVTWERGFLGGSPPAHLRAGVPRGLPTRPPETPARGSRVAYTAGTSGPWGRAVRRERVLSGHQPGPSSLLSLRSCSCWCIITPIGRVYGDAGRSTWWHPQGPCLVFRDGASSSRSEGLCRGPRGTRVRGGRRPRASGKDTRPAVPEKPHGHGPGLMPSPTPCLDGDAGGGPSSR